MIFWPDRTRHALCRPATLIVALALILSTYASAAAFEPPADSAIRVASGGTNDDCATPEIASDGENPFCTIGNDTDGLEHEICFIDDQIHHDDWFQYEAICEGELTVSTCDTVDFETEIALYLGCQPDDWTCPPGDDELLACDFTDPDYDGSEITVDTLLGQCYTIRVGGWLSGVEGCGTLNITCAACGDGEVNGSDEECDGDDDADCPGLCQPDCTCGPPVNDDCAGAIPVEDGLTDYSTVFATTDGLAHEDCQGSGQTFNDIWYEYTATCSGELTATMCEPGDAFYNTDLVIYDGCQPDIPCPPGDDDLLDCNDDDCFAPSGQNDVSRLEVPVVAENCYTIRVVSAAQGQFPEAWPR